MNPLLQLMKNDRPSHAVIGKAMELFREWADRLGKDGAIGKQIASYVLSSDMYEPATTEYHSNVAQQLIFGLGERDQSSPRSRKEVNVLNPKIGQKVHDLDREIGQKVDLLPSAATVWKGVDNLNSQVRQEVHFLNPHIR